MSTKNRNRGKRHERKIAELLSGKRTGVLGGEDVLHPLYAVECKSREKIPKWFMKFWEQTLKNCPEEKIPLLIIHKLNQRHTDDWVIVRLEDFLSLTEPTDEGEA